MENLPIIYGERVYLAPFPETNEFFLQYMEWLNSERVMCGTGDKHVYNLDDIRELHYKWKKDENNFTFAVFDKSSCKPIGDICLRERKDNSCEILIMIGTDYGKGKGNEAMKLLIKYGFEVLKLEKIYLSVFKDNINAVRLYKNLGFVVKEEIKGEREEYYMELERIVENINI